MAEPPVPCSSNNLPKDWTFRVMCSQNLELMLETCAPKSINVVTLCLFTITWASLDHPTRQVIASGSKKGMNGMASCGLVHQTTFRLAGLGPGSGWECEGPTVGWGSCHWWGLSHISSVSPGWFKADTGVGHSCPCGPNPSA